MKKTLVRTVTLLMALALLTACGQSGADKDLDTSTVAGHLAQYGLAEDDIKAEGFASFEGPADAQIKVVADEGQFDTWGRKIFDKTKSVSKDKTCYPVMFPFDEDPVEWEDGLELAEWCYKYKSQTVLVQLAPVDGGYSITVKPQK